MESKESPADIPQFLTLAEAAARFSLSRRSIERLVAAHKLQVVKIGRATRVSVSELNRFALALIGLGGAEEGGA